MPFYSDQDLEGFAKEATQAYLSRDIPLNESVIKIASENNLTKDQVDRVVEHSNNQTYLALFPKSENKYVEFPTADGEKVSEAVFGVSAGYNPSIDELEDYRVPPVVEKIAEFSVVGGEDTREPDATNLTPVESYKLAKLIFGNRERYEGIAKEAALKFEIAAAEYFNMIKQAVLKKEAEFGHIKQAAISAQEDVINMGVIRELFEKYAERLEELGVDKYPHYCDLSDNTTYLGEVETEHLLVKKAEELLQISADYITNLEKTGSARALIAAGLGGLVVGGGLTAGVMKKRQEKKELKDAIWNSPLSRENNPQRVPSMAQTTRF